jgi:hypothetical protein
MIMVVTIAHTSSRAAAEPVTPPVKTAAVATQTIGATAGERTPPPVEVSVVAAAPDTASGSASELQGPRPPQYMGTPPLYVVLPQ